MQSIQPIINLTELPAIEEIVEGCKKGKQSAQKHLFELYSGKMFRVCLYYTQHYEEAEDLLHDGFIRIFEKIGKYRDGNLEAWMKRVFINLALSAFRRKGKVLTLEDAGQISNPTVYLHDPVVHDEILAMIRSLPPRYRLVFNLFAIEGFAHKEIAEMLGIDEGTSKSNLSRARKILQTKLQETMVNE